MNCPDNSQDDPRAPYNERHDEGPVMMDCPACKGTGTFVCKVGKHLAKCHTCQGTGEVNAH